MVKHYLSGLRKLHGTRSAYREAYVDSAWSRRVGRDDAEVATCKLHLCVRHAKTWARWSWQSENIGDRREYANLAMHAVMDARYWRIIRQRAAMEYPNG